MAYCKPISRKSAPLQQKMDPKKKCPQKLSRKTSSQIPAMPFRQPRHPPGHPPARKMRHSRRLSSHPTQPQGPFCSHCEVNLSVFPAYIRCADPACHNIPICVDCFSVGAADEVPHQPNHAYRIVEKLSQPIFAADWAAHEELRLLDALSEHGPHHWKPVADYVGKTQRKCELHYEDVYLKGPDAPLPSNKLDAPAPTASPAVSTDAIEEADAPDVKPGQEDAPKAAKTGNQRKLKDKDSESESGGLEGYLHHRGDFDVEWDDKAEELIADLIIDSDDTDEEKELKMRLLVMYDQRLQRRNAVKDFLFSHDLLDFAKLKYDDRRGTRDEKELSARLQVFSRLLSKPEFEAFYSSVMTEYRISRDMYRMAQARKVGIRTKAEVDIYEVERKARYHRLGEQMKGKGKNKSVGKRRRSSAAIDTPTPTPTPLNSVPGTPGSMVLSPSNALPPAVEATPEKQNESTPEKQSEATREKQNESTPKKQSESTREKQGESYAVRRKARERKRIARSPYPVLEAMPVDEMDDAWKLSQTEKKLCSALRIPPAEFLRMRDAMLYTASQNIKRRGRPRKPGANTQVLTIRARRQAKTSSKDDALPAAPPRPEPAMILNTIPVTESQQQRVILRQKSTAPGSDSGPRVILTCKPPVTAAGNSETKTQPPSTTYEKDAANEKLRFNMKVIPMDVDKPADQAPTIEVPLRASIGGLVDIDDLPLSATFAQSHQLPTASPARATALSPVRNVAESVIAKESECLANETKEAADKKAVEVAKSGSKDEEKMDVEADAKTDKEPDAKPFATDERNDVLESGSENMKVDDLKDTEKNLGDDTLESETSYEADVIHVSTVDRPRPVTRSYAKRTKQTRETITVHLTKVSRSNSPCEDPRQHGIRPGPERTVVNVTALKVERPVTRAYAAQAQRKLENAEGQLSAPILNPEKENEGKDGSVRNAPVDPKLSGEMNDNDIRHNQTEKDASNEEIPTIPSTADAEEQAKVKAGRISEAINFRDDESCSGDEVDEVLCGEDGAKAWPTPGKPGVGLTSHTRTREASLDVVMTERPIKRESMRNGSDGEELLDQGRASIDSTPARNSQRLAKKHPKTPERVSQRLRGKKGDTARGTPERFAKKQPRRTRRELSSLEEKSKSKTQTPQNPGAIDGEPKETEIMIDGEGDVDGEQKAQMIVQDAGRSDASDSLEILSGGDGDPMDSNEKSPEQVEEVTLDEGQDAGAEEAKDVDWNPQDSGLRDRPLEAYSQTKRGFAVSQDKPSSQTEAGTEPGTPETSDHDKEYDLPGKSKETINDRSKRERAALEKETTQAVRKSSRVQKPSRRLEESAQASLRPAKRRRTSGRSNRASSISESPASESQGNIVAPTCAVITEEIGDASFDDLERTEPEGGTVSQRFRPDTPRSKKSSRQSTPSRLRYPVTERRVTRSAGRQTRSRSASLRRSLTDRLSLRRA